MSHSVANHLGLDPEEYDRTIAALIPEYHAMLDHAARAVAAVAPNRVIDLGAGTGTFSERVLSITGSAAIELWDVDRAMLDVARHRLRSYGDRARFVDRSFDSPLPPCQAVIASLALHHILVWERKVALYANIWSALEPGGAFVNADMMMPADPEQARAAYRFWTDHMVRHGMSEEEAEGRFDAWAVEDRYFPSADECAALEGLGFTARVIWSAGGLTVVEAVRPAGD